jgi:hypothetical protein
MSGVHERDLALSSEGDERAMLPAVQAVAELVIAEVFEGRDEFRQKRHALGPLLGVPNRVYSQ